MSTYFFQAPQLILMDNQNQEQWYYLKGLPGLLLLYTKIPMVISQGKSTTQFVLWLGWFLVFCSFQREDELKVVQ